MSEADDRAAGIAASQAGGFPDTSNPTQVEAWQVAQGYKALQAHWDQQALSTTDAYSPTPTPYQSSRDSSESSYSGGSTVEDHDWTPFNVFVLAVAGVIGAISGYSKVTRHASTQEVWLTAGGEALKAVLIVAATLAAIAGAYKALKYLMHGTASVTRTAIVKVPTRLRLRVLILGIAGLVGGYAGFMTEVDHHASGLDIMLWASGTALGAVLIVGAALAVLAGVVKVIQYGINGVASVTRSLFVRGFRG